MSQPCNCIKGNYDCILGSPDSSTLSYQDNSVWMTAESYEVPDQYMVDITIPGSSQPVSISVKTDFQNLIRPEDLGIGAKTLTDGIYQFQVSNCGTSYTRFKAVTAELECGLQKYIAGLQPDDSFDLAYKIDMLIKASHVNAQLGKTMLAQEFFKLAERELNQLNCECKR